jgi:hypothetical protein
MVAIDYNENALDIKMRLTGNYRVGRVVER